MPEASHCHHSESHKPNSVRQAAASVLTLDIQVDVLISKYCGDHGYALYQGPGLALGKPFYGKIYLPFAFHGSANAENCV
jgi:hypothetical protein